MWPNIYYSPFGVALLIFSPYGCRKCFSPYHSYVAKYNAFNMSIFHFLIVSIYLFDTFTRSELIHGDNTIIYFLAMPCCNFSAILVSEFWITNLYLFLLFILISWHSVIPCSPNAVHLWFFSNHIVICNWYCCYHKIYPWFWEFINFLVADNSYRIYVLTIVYIFWLCK